ncbi:DUF3122 domain-containing protein [Nodosilinea sp. LEGE 07298]|nr:DUF3122 domain-containing protein [Nodosilinea sp. LEGE 07298]
MRRILSLLTATALLGVCILGLVLQAAPALAAIRQLEEAPGQFVYQSRQTIFDQHGDRWQVIAFNRIRPDGHTSFDLRLVGFPGKGEIDRDRPLTLISSLKQTWTARDASSQIFTDASAPEPNVGQYDLQPMVAQLPTAIPMQLVLPIRGQDDAVLSLSPALIQEWKTVAAYD